MTTELNHQEKMRAQALEFLKNENRMVVSSVSDSGEPECALVYYTVDENFDLYFMTSPGSRKCENLRANGKTAFVIGTGPEVTTVQGGGRAKALDNKESEIFFELIKNGAIKTNKWPLLTLEKEGFCTFKIVPAWLTWFSMESKKSPSLEDEDFFKII